MTRGDTVWQEGKVAEAFLEGVRGGLPLAALQIDLIVRLARQALPTVERVLDLGCGDGVLGRAVLASHPQAECVFLDFSEPMLAAARAKAADLGPRATFVREDFGLHGWVEGVRPFAPFDLVVSGFAIHHQPDERKREVYHEIFGLLSAGGLFLNLEHVSSASAWAGKAYDELCIDALYAYHREGGGNDSREAVANRFYHRPDKAANILAQADEQCGWLHDIGYADVDCFFRLFEFALFGGRKPPLP
jgi:ubiquinone/menaquinone biosynthesis C-methylase UbiE